MSNQIDFPIDFILPWVDGADADWRRKKNDFLGKPSEGDDDVRYRDWGTLKYLLRSIDKFAPWVNKVYIVTDHQIPAWLATDCAKVQIVFHDEFIPAEYLPTFNSNAIELNMWRIAELSEHFVMFNDDFLLTRPVLAADFFAVDGTPRDFGAQMVLMPGDEFAHVAVNNLIVINKLINKREWLNANWRKAFSVHNGVKLNFLSGVLSMLPRFTRFFDSHTAISYRKSNFVKINELWPDVVSVTSQNHVRALSDYSHWVVRYYQLATGQFSPRSAKFGTYLNLAQPAEFSRLLTNKAVHTLVLNDVEMDAAGEQQAKQTMQLLDDFLPDKSSFEE